MSSVAASFLRRGEAGYRDPGAIDDETLIAAGSTEAKA